MRYVAGRDLHLGGGEYRAVGEEVPEAAGWTTIPAMVSTGELVLVLEDGEGAPTGVNPVDCVLTMDDALAKALGPRWLNASDSAQAEVVAEDVAPAVDATGDPEPAAEAAPEPERRVVKSTPAKKAPAKKATK